MNSDVRVAVHVVGILNSLLCLSQRNYESFFSLSHLNGMLSKTKFCLILHKSNEQ